MIGETKSNKSELAPSHNLKACRDSEIQVENLS